MLNLKRYIIQGPDIFLEFRRASRLTAQQLACPPEWRSEEICQLIGKPVMSLLETANTLLFTEPLDLHGNIVHLPDLNHICESLLHAAEVKRPTCQ